MTVVVILTLAGLVALVVAVITGSTVVALVVIVLAALGIILLLLDWRAEQRRAKAKVDDEPAPAYGAFDYDGAGQVPLSADMFSPDISTDPDGPPGNARAD